MPKNQMYALFCWCKITPYVAQWTIFDAQNFGTGQNIFSVQKSYQMWSNMVDYENPNLKFQICDFDTMVRKLLSLDFLMRWTRSALQSVENLVGLLISSLFSTKGIIFNSLTT